MTTNRNKAILIFILLVNLFLNTYGINWGLPNRWNVDEQVARVLRMANEKRVVPSDDFFHPTFYFFFLIFALIPFVYFLKFTGFNFILVKSAAGVSWLKLALTVPGFATNVYVYSRFMSCLLGVCSVYMVYIIARRIYNEKIGLLSAGILSVSMGFITENHYAKCDPLLHVLMLVTIYFCIRFIQAPNSKRDIFLASFFAGLSMATKYNAGILLIPLCVSYGISLVREYGISFNAARSAIFDRSIFKICGFYILGLLLGWPGIILQFHKYFAQASSYKVYALGYPSMVYHSYLIGMVNYFLQIILLFGVPIFIFVCIGLARYLLRPKQISGEILILLSFIIAYFLVVSSFRHMYHATTRYIVAIILFLSIFGGKGIYDFMISKTSRLFKYFIAGFIFTFSFFYTFSIDLLFCKNDTRYQSTNWILEHIPKGSTIEMFKQIDWLASAYQIAPNYNIVFYGSTSDIIDNRSLFKLYQDKNARKEYFRKLQLYGANSEYIMLIYENVSDIPYRQNCDSADFELEFLCSLVNGKQGYTLIKQFSHPNDKLKSKSIKGLSYPRSIFWNPNPDSYTSPTILIYKKI